LDGGGELRRGVGVLRRMIWYGWQIVDTSLLLDERSSTALAFSDVDLLQRVAGGGALMLVRYGDPVIPLLVSVRSRYDDGGHLPGHELPANIVPPSVR